MDMNMPGMATTSAPATLGIITEFSLNWPNKKGSTHELVISDKYVFVTGQIMGMVAKFDYKGNLLDHYLMDDGTTGPHGLLINKHGQLWVSLEFTGEVVRLDDHGKIVQRHDVKMYAKGAKKPINPAPHGIGLGTDGETIWFTGKRTSTIGRILPNGDVEHFELGTLASLPIFLSCDKKGGIWGTELLGNCILHISATGDVKEYPIPTSGSRPIAVIPDPVDDCMWFTQEAGGKIGKIDAAGNISEYPVPRVQNNDILASLCFDREMNLWVQVYVDTNNPKPDGNDYIVKLDKTIRQQCGTAIMGIPYATHIIPSRMAMMHRIRLDNEGNLWFTEMMTDKLGKITLNRK